MSDDKETKTEARPTCALCQQPAPQMIQHPNRAWLCMQCAKTAIAAEENMRRSSEHGERLRLAIISAYVTAEVMRGGPTVLPSNTLRAACEFADKALAAPATEEVH